MRFLKKDQRISVSLENNEEMMRHVKFETILDSEYLGKYQSVWPNKTILDYLNEAIAKFPDKIAIIDKKSRYTYRELGKMVDRVSLGLLSSPSSCLTGMNLLFCTMRRQELGRLLIRSFPFIVTEKLVIW